MKHILIVGGTGMLRKVATHYIEQGHIVSIMARNKNRLNAFKKEYPVKKGRIWPIPQDYHNSKQALQKIKEAADMFIRIDMAILWIHDTGSRFSEQVKKFLFLHNPLVKVYQVWGSSAVNPLGLSQSHWREEYPHGYREIFLGYHRNDLSSRWLYDGEIADGVIRAVKDDKTESTIGILAPWKNHP